MEAGHRGHRRWGQAPRGRVADILTIRVGRVGRSREPVESSSEVVREWRGRSEAELGGGRGRVGVQEWQWQRQGQPREGSSEPREEVSLGDRRGRGGLLLLLPELHELAEAVFQHVGRGPDGLRACQGVATHGWRRGWRIQFDIYV